MAELRQANADRHWYIVGRWQEFEGESRANQLRILAVGIFYTIQLVQFHFFSAPADRDFKFHRAASALAAAGVLVALAVQLCLRRRIFPAALKYVSTAADLLLVSCLAALGSGPQSPFDSLTSSSSLFPDCDFESLWCGLPVSAPCLVTGR